MSSINLGEHQGDGIRYSMHLSAPAGGAAQMLRDPAGNWVGYAEYAALQAENERLRTFSDEAQAHIAKQETKRCEMTDTEDTENARLQAENERLRKAGDELARVAIPSYILDTKVKAIEAWNAAKESRQ
jgi:regulator of replication initiation timing